MANRKHTDPVIKTRQEHELCCEVTIQGHNSNLERFNRINAKSNLNPINLKMMNEDIMCFTHTDMNNRSTILILFL